MTSHIYRLTELEKNSFKKALTLLLIIIFALLGGVSRAQKLGSVYNSQDKNLSVKRGTSLEKALEILKQDYDIGFLYKPKLLEGKKVPNDLALPKNFDEALKIILKDHGLKFKRLNSQTYGIYKAKIQNSVSQPTQKTVTGSITDTNTGQALPGVNIVLKGTTTGTTSNNKGHYSITVPSRTDTLIFSFVGYVNKTIPIQGREEINVKLKSKTIQGEEAVVTAFGVTKKEEDVVGAVTSLDQQQLNALKTAPTANLTASLAGRIQGLIGFQRNGAPGENNAEFFIRGVTTFGYDNSPLILIDGIKSTTDDLARLNPNDVANFSILKDATATSLYGSEAANGVILVKTKQGEKGETKIDLRISTNVSQPTQVPKFADPITFMEDANQATRSRKPLEPLPYSQRKIDKTKQSGSNPYLYPAINWREKLFKNYAVNQKANMSVSGGGSIANYYVSGAFQNSNGLFRVPNLNNFNNNINYKNYSLRSNIDVNLTNSTELSTKLSGDFTSYNGALQSGSDVYHQLTKANPVHFPPTYPVDSAHAYTDQPLFGMNERNNEVNPYAEMVKGYKHRQRATINTQFIIKQDLSSLTEGLGLKARINLQRFALTSVNRTYNPFYYHASPVKFGADAYNSYVLKAINPEGGTNYLSYHPQSKTVTSKYLFQAQAHYQHTFGEKEGVSSFLVFKARNQTYDNASDLQASLPHRNVNFAGRLTYNHNHIYYAEFNFGYNASERFAKHNRWGFFPSVGVAWNVSNQKFWKPIQSVINRFKIRATYGLSGNDNIGSNDHRFLYLSKVNLDDPAYGYTTGVNRSYGVNGVSLSRYANPQITWERAKKANLGINLEILNQIKFKANLYYQTRTDILETRVDLPASLGLDNIPSANAGEAKSHGISAHIKYTPHLNKNWALQVRGNFTYGTNEYVKYSEPNYPSSPNKSHIGQPVNQQFGLYADYLFIDEQEVENLPPQRFGTYSAGDIKYRDVNNDGQITDLDYMPLGYPRIPEVNYGFGFSIAFKNIDLSTFFEGLLRESFWMNEFDSFPYINGNQLLQAYADNHWTTKNRNLTALFPRFNTRDISEGYSNNNKYNTWFMRNGAFLRAKEIQIGYSLPQPAVNRLSLRKVRFYFNVRNAFHISPFKMWDPEMGGKGLGYPLQRNFNLGINIKF